MKLLPSWVLEWLGTSPKSEPRLWGLVKINIQYADSNGGPFGECYFDPGLQCNEYEDMLKAKVGQGQMYKGPVMLMSPQLGAGEYTYLIPGAAPAGKKPILVPPCEAPGERKGSGTCRGLPNELKEHLDLVIASRLQEALGAKKT